MTAAVAAGSAVVGVFMVLSFVGACGGDEGRGSRGDADLDGALDAAGDEHTGAPMMQEDAAFSAEGPDGGGPRVDASPEAGPRDSSVVDARLDVAADVIADPLFDSADAPRDAPWDGGMAGTCDAPILLSEVTVSGDTTAAANTLDSSCSSVQGSGPEIVYRLRGVETGRFEVEIDSVADLGLSVQRGCDPASEIVCEDSVVGGHESVSVPVVAGRDFLLLVQGWNTSAAGPFSLDVNFVPAECGDGALDGGEGCDDHGRVDGDGCSSNCEIEACSSPMVLDSSTNGDTSLSAAVVDTTCANDLSGPEDIYAFTAPLAGTYGFIASPAPDVDLVLAVRPSCESSAGELCADDAFSGSDERLFRFLEANETIFVVVEGWGVGDAGSYTLEVVFGD